MATVKQIELPDELVRAIERRAAIFGHSFEEQVVSDLRFFAKEKEELAEEQLMVAVRREREELATRGVWATEEEINAAKVRGRK
jgi:plasmid stability protein